MIRPRTRVVDASILVASIVDPEERGDWARAMVFHDLAAPALLHAEVTNALRRIESSDPSTPRLPHLRALAEIPVEIYPWSPFAERIWELRHNLTPYDAWYVALAESLDAPFLTLDARLARAPGIRCEIEVGPGAG